MTVSSTINAISYTGNSILTTFAYTFRIFADTDLQVYVNGVLKTLTTDYTVTGAGNVGGGNVIFGVAPAAVPITIKRVVATTQGTVYVSGDSFPTKSTEDAFDRLTMICQQLQDRMTAVAFSTLPAAINSKGQLAVVSDSTTAVWGAIITGGGANVVLAFCNGTNWKVAA